MSLSLKYTLTSQLLTDIALGKDKSLPRNIAIQMLPTSKLPNSAEILNRVLENDGEEPGLRRLAAVGLWRLNTAEALAHLREAAETVRDTVALAAIVKCLGRVGDEDALNVILRIKRTAQGELALQASFAASLISYRLGLPGNDLPVPSRIIDVPMTDEHRFDLVAASEVEKDLFTSCLAREPYGIEFSEDLLLQVSCPGGRWMIGFNRDIVRAKAINLLQHRKAFLGIIAAKHSEDGRYSASYLILTAPGDGGAKIDILINRITGTPAWAGTTTSISGDHARFVIRTVGSIGIAPMKLEGLISANGEISITSATTASKVSEKRHAHRLDIKLV